MYGSSHRAWWTRQIPAERERERERQSDREGQGPSVSVGLLPRCGRRVWPQAIHFYAHVRVQVQRYDGSPAWFVRSLEER